MESINKGNYYSIDDVCGMFDMTKRRVRELRDKGVFKGEIANEIYLFTKEPIDQILDLLSLTYSTSEVLSKVWENERLSTLTNSHFYKLIKRSDISTYRNPINPKKDSYRILKEDMDKVISYLGSVYGHSNRTFEAFEPYVNTVDSIPLISDNEEYLDYSFLKECYLRRHKRSRVQFNQVVRHVIEVCSDMRISWYSNEYGDNIYIKKQDEAKFLDYYIQHERTLQSDMFYVVEDLEEMFVGWQGWTIAKHIGAEMIDGRYYLDKGKVDNLYMIYTETITLAELSNMFREEFGILKGKLQKVLDKLSINYVSKTEHPFGNHILVFKKDVDRIRDYLVEEKLLLNSTPYEKYKILSKKIDSSNIPETTALFEKFVLNRCKKLKNADNSINSFVRIFHTLSNQLQKEITECSDDENLELVENMEFVKMKIEFANFVNSIKNKRLTKYNNMIQIEKGTGEVTTEPFTYDQWVQFGILLFNENYPKREEYIEKAINSHIYAMIWLYCALHYVCGWRRSDLNNLPKPSIDIALNMNKDEVFDSIRSRKFTEDMAQTVVNDVLAKIKAFRIRPMKTEHTSQQPLKLVVERSYVHTIGMLLALCEAHRIERENIRTGIDYYTQNEKQLFTSSVSSYDKHLSFFGEDYKMIFGDVCFTNMRGNKTFLNIVQLTSQEEGWGIGYYLASIIRGHKLGQNGVSDTTQVYLEYINKSRDIERITQSLFERGTFGFVPYMMLKAINGVDVIKLDMEEQNHQIKELIPMKPYMVEWMSKSVNESRSKAKKFVKELFLASPDKIVGVLKNIVNGVAPSKMEHSHCLLKAIDKSNCIYPSRTDCVGCDYLIPEMYFLIELNTKLQELLNKIKKAKNELDKERYSYALLYVFLPILQEAVLYFGKDRLGSFIDLPSLKESMSKLGKANQLLSVR